MMKNKKGAGFTLLNNRKANLTGFTLIELLVVIAIITILAAAIVVGINPAKHFKAARNASRWSQMNTIATGVYSYAVEHGGTFPVDPDGPPEYCIAPWDAATPVDIGTNPTAWCYDTVLGESLMVPDYIRTLPADPSPGEVYQIQFVDANEDAIRITSSAGEASEVILIQ